MQTTTDLVYNIQNNKILSGGHIIGNGLLSSPNYIEFKKKYNDVAIPFGLLNYNYNGGNQTNDYIKDINFSNNNDNFYIQEVNQNDYYGGSNHNQYNNDYLFDKFLKQLNPNYKTKTKTKNNKNISKKNKYTYKSNNNKKTHKNINKNINKK